ncbi:hypothetical protein FQA47_011365 [Oryzias melastigma]|uniref:Uncharacterized protein n=1 Tax=Oryzias melastigma TaxID=30732 RepID=A0A834FMU4_ORYME|nr:hypothetical protein FQA47_011365 [Oryzias melastigma]
MEQSEDFCFPLFFCCRIPSSYCTPKCYPKGSMINLRSILRAILSLTKCACLFKLLVCFEDSGALLVLLPNSSELQIYVSVNAVRGGNLGPQHHTRHYSV